MVRTLALAAFVTLFGAGASQAQYRDSAPADEQNQSPQYRSDTAPDGYDEELLGPYQDQQYNNNDGQYGDRYSDHGYSRPDVDVGIFANLSDGRWFMTANFGWVWRPYAASGWRPYTDGRWVWTSYGWTWVSYEPFGWATYHYGYWNCDSALGWVWIPGYEWSACRAQWAYYDNYVAWAPMYPPGYNCPRPFTTAGFNIWFTIGANHFCDPYPTRYCVTSYDNVYTQRVAYKSPGRSYVQQYTRTPIRESSVSFKHTKFERSSNGYGATRSQTVFKSKSSKSYSQPFVQNSRPNVQSKQKFNGSSRQFSRDSRTFAQREPQRQSKQQFKSSPQRKSSFDVAMERQRQPGVTRQYRPRETQRSVSREAMKPRFETHGNQDMRSAPQQRSAKQFAGSGGSQRVQREAPSRQAQRSVDRGSSKQSHDNVAKMKGGNWRGNGKH
ncbi:MAG TPA: DUF6600 domain-containing protein [Candidatus Krumholzibacteria bacterium]|nr:DUF6600 domain-containing protein [Candidatus Krumholzibacteria bacterium]